MDAFFIGAGIALCGLFIGIGIAGAGAFIGDGIRWKK
jgi:hypothetical protein